MGVDAVAISKVSKWTVVYGIMFNGQCGYCPRQQNSYAWVQRAKYMSTVDIYLLHFE